MCYKPHCSQILNSKSEPKNSAHCIKASGVRQPSCIQPRYLGPWFLGKPKKKKDKNLTNYEYHINWPLVYFRALEDLTGITRKTTLVSMVRSCTSVTSTQRDTVCYLTGKLIRKSVGLEDPDVTVVLSSREKCYLHLL